MEKVATFMEDGKVVLVVVNQSLDVLLKIAFDRISRNDTGLKSINVMVDDIGGTNYWFIQSENCKEHALIRQVYEWELA